MNDLISREAAIEEFEDMVTSVSVYGESAEAIYATNALIRFIEKLKSIPTIDAAPVVYGRWIKGGYACGENEYKCSVCGETERRTNCTSMRYCMHCGARMDDQPEKTT